jgi:hypothetical protein
LGSSPPRFLKGDALARIQLTCSLLSLAQKLRLIGLLIAFLLKVNPFEKMHPRFLGKLSDGFFNFLNGAHNATLSQFRENC